MTALFETYEKLGFSHWAPALFNDDESGMDDRDCRDLEDWLADIPGGAAGPVDMREEGFKADVYDGLAGDGATYIFAIHA